MKDLTGREFGRLTVIKKSEVQNKGRVRWYCECKCGNSCDVESKNLLSDGTKSCGCIAKESSSTLAKTLAENRKGKGEIEVGKMHTKAVETRKDRHYIDGVDTTALTQKIRTDNKSGTKGVSYDKGRSKWKADIAVNNKTKFIGRFDTLEEAKEARRQAEIIYHAPILEQRNQDGNENK